MINPHNLSLLHDSNDHHPQKPADELQHPGRTHKIHKTHAIAADGSYHCQFCEKTFPRLGYLKKHEQVNKPPSFTIHNDRHLLIARGRALTYCATRFKVLYARHELNKWIGNDIELQMLLGAQKKWSCGGNWTFVISPLLYLFAEPCRAYAIQVWVLRETVQAQEVTGSPSEVAHRRPPLQVSPLWIRLFAQVIFHLIGLAWQLIVRLGDWIYWVPYIIFPSIPSFKFRI